MNDRDLLERAAKLMQRQGDRSFANFDVLEDGSGVCLELGCKRGAITSYWKPLTDNSDAFQLAVELRIELFFFPDRVETHVAGERIPPVKVISREPLNNNPYAATRRAIVRAAAAIGESTP